MTGRTIDLHAHFIPPAYVDLMQRLAREEPKIASDARLTYEAPIRARSPLFSGALRERLAMMDAAGIATQVLSFSSPNIWHPDPPARAAIVRTYNDGMMEVCQAHPRLKLFANLPLPFANEAIVEAQRLAGQPEVVGFGIATYAGDIPLDDHRLLPVYAQLNAIGLPVFIHPDRFSVRGALAAYGMEWGLGAPFDDTIATVRIVRSGITRDYPRIRWIIPHLGGTLPLLYDRVVEQGATAGPGEAPLPSFDLSGIHFDTCSPSVGALRLARDVLGVDNLVFGSDFPYVARHDLSSGVGRLKDAGYSDDEAAAILHTNAAQRLGIDSG